MRVILATPPEYRRLKTPAQVLGPPIGLMYMASYARQNGYLERIDALLEIFDAFTIHMDPETFVREVIRKRPDVLGLTVTSRMFQATMYCLGKIHEAIPETKIVLGGIHPTFLADKIIRTFPFVDCVLKGEAEKSFSELLVAYSEGSDDRNIKGITAIRNGEFVDNEPEAIADLDELPFPARGLVANIRYGYTWNGIDLTYGKFTSIVTSRGCPFTCNFCTNWRFSDRQLRLRSIENVAEELELIQSEGYDSCVVIDDIFTIDKKRVMEICCAIKERDIDLVLYCEGRVDSHDPEMFRAMRNVGFSSILFGIESGSQKVLDFYHKQTTPQLTKTAVRNAKSAGLQAIGAFIIGAPVEKTEDIENTLRHIAELELDGLEVNALGIAPWDFLYFKAARNQKVGKNDWLRDHLVSDYYDNLSKEELAFWVEQAYYSFFRIGMFRNLKKLMMYSLRRRDSRNAIIRNLLNKYSWKLVKEGGRPSHKIEEILMSGTDDSFISKMEMWLSQNQTQPNSGFKGKKVLLKA